MTFDVLSLSDSDKWDKYIHLLNIQNQDIYYTPEYYRVYEELGNGMAQCFVFKMNNEIAIYPFLKNSVNNIGYDLNDEYYDIQGVYGYNGVVSSTQKPEFISAFYKSFDLYCQNEKIIAEFTRFHPLIGNKSFSENHLHVFFDRKTIYIDLRNPYEIIFKKFQTTTRKQIKRAENRNGIKVIKYENDTSILDIFWMIYTVTMNRVQAIPYLYFSKDYFKSLIENTKSICLLAFYEDKPIAAIIALYNDYYIHGHLGGVLTEFLHLSPFSLLYSEMIKVGQNKSCNYLHVGGGATNNLDDPLLKFKMNFSNLYADFFIGKKIHNHSIYNKVISQWEMKSLVKKKENDNILLKYRY